MENGKCAQLSWFRKKKKKIQPFIKNFYPLKKKKLPFAYANPGGWGGLKLHITSLKNYGVLLQIMEYGVQHIDLA